MSFVQPFGTGQFADLSTGEQISTILPMLGIVGYAVQNITPNFFDLIGDDGNLAVSVPPWSIVLGNFTKQMQSATLQSDMTAPSVPVKNITYSQWQVKIELSPQAVQPGITQLSVANAADVNAVINGDVTINTSGGPVPISGTVNANITNANINATVTGAVDANITNATLNVGSVGGITDNINAAVVNTFLTTGPLINAGSESYVTGSVPVGGYYYHGFSSILSNPNGPVLVDEIYIVMTSASSMSNLVLDVDNLINWPIGNDNYGGAFGGITSRDVDNGAVQLYKFIPPVSVRITGFTFSLINNGSAVFNDTVTMYVWYRHASAKISNTATDPVQSQTGQGAFGELYSVDNVNIGQSIPAGSSLDVTETVVSSAQGGYLKQLVVPAVSVGVSGTSPSARITVEINGQTIYDTGYSSADISLTDLIFNFSDGVAVGSGVLITITSYNGDSVTVTLDYTCVAYATTVQTTAPSTASVIA